MALTSKALKRMRAQFLDETVVIYLKGMDVVTVSPNGEEMSISAMTEAYVVDIDECYLYLGLPDGTVTRVISHEIAPMIELAMSAEDQVMAMQLPGEGEDVH